MRMSDCGTLWGSSGSAFRLVSWQPVFQPVAVTASVGFSLVWLGRQILTVQASMELGIFLLPQPSKC